MKTQREIIQEEVDFRRWMFGLALAELKKHYNRAYAENLEGKVAAFIDSNAVKEFASDEQKESLSKILSDLGDC